MAGTVTCSVDGCDRPVSARGWCARHYGRWYKHGDVLADKPIRVWTRSFEERLWRGVDKNGPISDYRPDLGSCWIWKGRLKTTGYGRVWTEGRRSVPAHVAIYKLLVGPIPDGLFLDHLCRVRACVNPDHLEPVTNRENLLRGNTFVARNVAVTHCPQGHPYAGDNLYVRPNGKRHCRACHKAEQHERYHRLKAKMPTL